MGNAGPIKKYDASNEEDLSYLDAYRTYKSIISISWKKSESEFMTISVVHPSPNFAKEFLSYGPKIVIIKMGSKGSLVAQKNSINYVSVVQGVDVFDPTGAGDSFAGGLLGYVSINGLSDVNKAVAYGSAVASYTVAGFGLECLEKINFEDLKLKADSIDIK